MPYILDKDRDKYDASIKNLALMLNGLNKNDVISGELNYVLFRLATHLCDSTLGGREDYARMAVILSAMNEAQHEFRRRIMSPYEDIKIDINGDVLE